jgi:hypothetical protein
MISHPIMSHSSRRMAATSWARAAGGGGQLRRVPALLLRSRRQPCRCSSASASQRPAGGAATAAAAPAGATLVDSWQPARQLRVELHRTPDMVSAPPGGACDCVITAANEKLIGTALSYFPRGGPCPEPPPPGVSNSWGGMEAGSGMLYPTQSVDGRVHQEGGAELRAACAALPEQPPSSGVRCPPGSAALTPAFGNLLPSYRFVLHAVAPFRSDERWEPRLTASFVRTFDLILYLVGAREAGELTVAIPLLGAVTFLSDKKTQHPAGKG